MAKRSKMTVMAEFEGFDSSIVSITEMGKRAARARPLMEKMVGVLQVQQTRRINQSPYTELEESTQTRKTSEYENPKPFRDEGRWIRGQPTRVPEATYLGVTSKSYPGQVRIATNASATFGLRSAGNGPFFYLRFAQSPKKGKKRKLLAISRANAIALAEITVQYITFGWQGRREGFDVLGRPMNMGVGRVAAEQGERLQAWRSGTLSAGG